MLEQYCKNACSQISFFVVGGLFLWDLLNMPDISMPLIEKHDNIDIKTERGLQREVKTVF